MAREQRIEYRYYDIPTGELTLTLAGPSWFKEYGEGRDRLHFHNYFEVGICHEGEGEMILGENEVRFCPGCISVIPSMELHTTNTFGEKASWSWMYFDLNTMLEELYPDDELTRDNIREQVLKHGKLFTPEYDIQKMRFLVSGIFDEMRRKEYMYKDMVKHLLLMLTVEIIRKMQTHSLPERVPVKINIVPAIEYTRLHYDTPIRISTLAKCCSMSESHFRKVFEKYMNMKPLDYVNFVRVQKSCSLLRDDALSIIHIANLVGYESVTSYIRNFKKIIGYTPHQWRSDEKLEQSMKYNITALKGWLE